jgi:hypothetical protein
VEGEQRGDAGEEARHAVVVLGTAAQIVSRSVLTGALLV